MATHRWRGVRYFDSEDGDSADTTGTPVVLVHGLGNSLQFWVSVAPLLSRSARVVAMDVPGFGRSDPAADNDLDSYVAVIAGLLDHLGVHDYHVVGHSMGSVVAAALAHHEQRRVVSLTLLDGIPYRAIEMIKSPRLVVRDPGLAVNLAAQVVGGVIPLGSIGARLVTSFRLLRRLALWPYVADPATLPRDAAAVALIDNGGIGPVRAILLARRTPLDHLVLVPSIPVRVICGAGDRLVSRADVERTARRYGAVDQLIVDGAGHWPLLEKPDVVATFIASFL